MRPSEVLAQFMDFLIQVTEFMQNKLMHAQEAFQNLFEFFFVAAH